MQVSLELVSAWPAMQHLPSCLILKKTVRKLTKCRHLASPGKWRIHPITLADVNRSKLWVRNVSGRPRRPQAYLRMDWALRQFRMQYRPVAQVISKTRKISRARQLIVLAKIKVRLWLSWCLWKAILDEHQLRSNPVEVNLRHSVITTMRTSVSKWNS